MHDPYATPSAEPAPTPRPAPRPVLTLALGGMCLLHAFAAAALGWIAWTSRYSHEWYAWTWCAMLSALFVGATATLARRRWGVWVVCGFAVAITVLRWSLADWPRPIFYAWVFGDCLIVLAIPRYWFEGAAGPQR